MIRPKRHIEDIYRTPPVEKSRMGSLRMDKNEFLPCWPESWFRDFLKQLKPEHISMHPELEGLYAKLSRTLGFSRDSIVVTAGSDAAIRSVFEVFVEPCDGVVIPSPTFAMYYVYSKIYRANLIEIAYDEDLKLDIERLMGSLNEKIKLIAIANPNSPTGTVIEENDLIKIIKKASDIGIAVLLDEAYFPFYEKSAIGLVNRFDNLIITRTFSKAAGLAGMRAGYIVSNTKLAKLLFAVKPMYEITSLSTLLAEYALDNYKRVYDYAEETRAGKKFLAEYFTKKGYRVFLGHANFLLVDFGRETEKNINFLQQNNILFKHSYKDPSLRNFVRFTVGPKESLKQFVKIFNKIGG